MSTTPHRVDGSAVTSLSCRQVVAHRTDLDCLVAHIRAAMADLVAPLA